MSTTVSAAAPRPLIASITYNLSQTGQKALLLRGGDGKRTQRVEGEVNPNDLDYFDVTPDGNLVAEVTAGWVPRGSEEDVEHLAWAEVTFDAPESFEELLSFLKERQEKRVAHAARLRNEREAALQARRAARSRLEDWAQTHGGEHLRERLRGGFQWVGLARQEFTDGHLKRLPKGFMRWGKLLKELGYGDTDVNSLDRSRPAHAELAALEKVTKLEAPYENPRLMLNIHTDESRKKTKFTTIDVDVRCPDDRLMRVSQMVKKGRPGESPETE